MPVEWRMSEDEKKGVHLMFIEELWKSVSVVYNWVVLAHFGTENCIWILRIILCDFDANVAEYILLNVWNNLALVIIESISRPKCL